MLHTLENGVVIFLAVMDLIAFRLLFGLPSFRGSIRYLPARWQRWLYGEPELPGKQSH